MYLGTSLAAAEPRQAPSFCPPAFAEENTGLQQREQLDSPVEEAAGSSSRLYCSLCSLASAPEVESKRRRRTTGVRRNARAVEGGEAG
jgi:hypothetical protein